MENTQRNTRYTFIISFISALGGYLFGFDFAVISGTLPFLKEKLGTFRPFWMYAIICFLGFWFIRSKVKETKGKTLEQMEDVFLGH